MSTYLIARDCTGRCNQGRACTCTNLWQRSGGHRIDTEQMRATGAIEGPYRRTKPVTVGFWRRLMRALA